MFLDLALICHQLIVVTCGLVGGGLRHFCPISEVFRIGRVDCPCVMFRIVPAWSLENGEGFQIGPTLLLSFFYTMLLSAHVERVIVSRRREEKPIL